MSEPRCEGRTPFDCGNPTCPAHQPTMSDYEEKKHLSPEDQEAWLLNYIAGHGIAMNLKPSDAAPALREYIAAIVEDEIASRYHPEFGTEWREDGSLYKIVEEARAQGIAEAWDEGYTSGHSNAMRRMSDEPNAPTTPNPYRADTKRPNLGNMKPVISLLREVSSHELVPTYIRAEADQTLGECFGIEVPS